MKPLTVHLPDDVYERAERRAVDRGGTLPAEAAELIKRYSEGNGEGVANGCRETMRQGESSKDARSEVFQELAAVAEECRLPNWDSQGAAPVSQDTLGHARSLVDALPRDYPL